jgi:AcrR family transcriptional regulator
VSTTLSTEQNRPASVRVDSILRAACHVIVREGAHGLRMATVAAEAGVSKALVHYYFSTRQELLRKAFAYADRHLNEAVDADLAQLGTGREKLVRALVAGVEPGPPYSEQRSLYNEVWTGLRYDDELRPLVVECYAASVDRLVALIEEGQADGSVPSAIDARTSGTRLAATADGLDSMLYLGLVDNAEAAALAETAVERELAV